MIATLFLRLTDYPFFRRLMWKPIYETLAKKIQLKDWQFMNYGYLNSEYEKPLLLSEKDELNRYSIQLYHYLASKICISGLNVLEVGSGRGGGVSYLKRYLHPKSIIGLDIAHHAVKWANQQYLLDGVSFIQGTAEKLPFDNCSFDVLINVESCHAYGSVPKFLSEVKRVLKPGGYFLCTDIRSPNGMQTLKENLIASGMELLVQEDITENVINAIEKEDLIKRKRITENIPLWFQPAFKEFAGVRDSKIHKDLKSFNLIYHRFVLQNSNSKN